MSSRPNRSEKDEKNRNVLKFVSPQTNTQTRYLLLRDRTLHELANVPLRSLVLPSPYRCPFTRSRGRRVLCDRVCRSSNPGCTPRFDWSMSNLLPRNFPFTERVVVDHQPFLVRFQRSNRRLCFSTSSHLRNQLFE